MTYKVILVSDGNKPLIVGSIGPYGASLHDASEYTGEYANDVTQETMRNWHRPRMETLVEAGVDILALETIPCAAEAEMLVEMIKDYPQVKAWLCFSCRVSFYTSFFAPCSLGTFAEGRQVHKLWGRLPKSR